jgi:hypothetical protein
LSIARRGTAADDLPLFASDFQKTPSSRRRSLNPGLDARDQIACTAKATLKGREAEHD